MYSSGPQEKIDRQTRTEIAHAIVIIEDDDTATNGARHGELTRLRRPLKKIGVDMNKCKLQILELEATKGVAKEPFMNFDSVL